MTQLTTVHDTWAAQFEAERTRLITALRHVTDGGVVDEIVHVGPTSIPGLQPNVPIIALAAAVWPFPLEKASLAQLATLGYTLLTHEADAPLLTFQHESSLFALYVWAVADDGWFDLIYTCDYLRNNEAALNQYIGAPLLPTPPPEVVSQARAWWCAHYDFGPLHTVADTLRDFPAPWYISSGWALELFLDKVTRCHYDVDVVVARQDQLLLQQYLTERGWRFATYWEGKVGPWPLHMRLELPRHQVHAHRDGALLDVLFTDITDGVWRYRRNPSIIQTVERMALETATGTRFLAPELVLLFKSKTTGNKARPQDQADFLKVYPHLDPARRAWLRWVLLVTNPHHAWLALLD
ncbi:MAG: GrpB family protein [Caldilineaceae bacterium]